MREIMGFECKHFPIEDGRSYVYGCFFTEKENAPHHGGCEAAEVFPQLHHMECLQYFRQSFSDWLDTVGIFIAINEVAPKIDICYIGTTQFTFAKGGVVVDWMLFWTAFGAIGGTIGAFATAAAVIVALWQVRHQENKKLRLRFSDSMVMFSVDPSIPEETFICLSITNIGNRKVIVQNWGFACHKKNCYGLLGINQSQLTLGMNPSLPYALEIENKIDLYLERKYFVRNLKEGIAEKNLNPRCKLVFFVSDSAGKTYRLKSNKTIGEMIKP